MGLLKSNPIMQTGRSRVEAAWDHRLDQGYRLAVVPQAAAYALALSQPFVKDHHRRLLTAHAAAPGLIVGVEELALRIGARGCSYVNLHYGVLGHRVASFLDLAPPGYSQGPLWTTALAEGARMGLYRRWYWRLYPEVHDALETLGWTAEEALSERR